MASDVLRVAKVFFVERSPLETFDLDASHLVDAETDGASVLTR